MKPTRTRLMGFAIAMSAIAIAAPMSTAGAATAAPAVAPQAATVTGPTFVTSAGATFTNNNAQVSAGGISAGNQVAT